MIELSLILFKTSGGIYWIPKELKNTDTFLSKNNEIQCVPLVCFSSRFITFAASFISGKLSLEKTPLKLGF